MQDKFLKKYHGHIFEDSGVTCSEDFRKFAKDFKTYLQQNLPSEAKITKHYCGHYGLSGFVRYKRCCVYYSWSWNRYSAVNVHGKRVIDGAVLIRYAKNDTDYTGENNQYCSIEELPEMISFMFCRRAGKETA